MRILVTGGNGFVGSHVVEELARDEHDLRLLLRPTSRLEHLGTTAFERADGDVRDEAGLRQAVQGVDAVVHLAGLTTALREDDYMHVNAEGTAFLVNAAAEFGVRRFVYLSSLAAQGPSVDGSALGPVSAYGRSKLKGEEFALRHTDRMEVVIIRSPVVYGPRDRGLLPFFKLMKLGIVPLFGDGSNRFSWVHAHDFASAIAAAVTKPAASGSVYTIADGLAHSWRELASLLATAMHKRPLFINVSPFLYATAGAVAGLGSQITRRPLLLNPEKVVEMRQRLWACDSERIASDLGWKPRIGPEEGIGLTLRWYQEQRWL